MNLIKERRLQLQMTQAELSAMLRVTDPRIDVSMVSRFEQDVCLPTEKVMTALEEALQTDRHSLYSSLELLSLPQETSVMSQSTETLAKVIPFGRDHAISRERLAELLAVADRTMREMISRARREGLVIINDQRGGGYYRSDDIEDLNRQLTQTHNRALKLLVQEKHLRERIRALTNG